MPEVDLDQVERPTLRDRELAARAFELFDAGKSCREVVIELRQPAEVVIALYNDFARL